MAETKKEANAAFDLFVETYGVKYERAVARLVKDRDVLLTFYDFPAEHWKHIRTRPGLRPFGLKHASGVFPRRPSPRSKASLPRSAIVHAKPKGA